MENPKWFERSFDLNFDVAQFHSIYGRLKEAPDKLRQAAAGLSEKHLVAKPGGKWSVKEQAAHLALMEPLWRTRFMDIKQRKPVLTVADLNNRATTDGGFNVRPIEELLQRFSAERAQTLLFLDGIDTGDKESTSLHPRLKQPMRIVDLAYFVAEHDDHHLAILHAMRAIVQD
jgi:uncharacterized damage-inducible protein DinB